MKAVEVACAILQQQRGRPDLVRFVALLQIRVMGDRKSLIEAHGLVPRVGKTGEAGIKGGPQSTQNIRQWIFEITVFPLAEAVPRHDDMATEMLFLGIK